jgi:hypothetical protein
MALQPQQKDEMTTRTTQTPASFHHTSAASAPWYCDVYTVDTKVGPATSCSAPKIPSHEFPLYCSFLLTFIALCEGRWLRL